MEEVRDIVDGIIDEDFSPVPEYGFTPNDVMERLRERGMKVPNSTTIRRRLEKRVVAGELLKFKPSAVCTYYVPIHLAKNAELDIDAIMDVGE